MAIAKIKQNLIPTVACVNKSGSNFGIDFNKLIVTLQKFLDECFSPVWGAPARLTIKRSPDAWEMVFYDDADAAGAAGYHDLTHSGSPLAKVFVKSCLDSQKQVSVIASQELASMLIDPTANLWAVSSSGTLHAYDPCNAVDGEEFAIDGIAVSNFLYPAYFESFKHRPGVQFDHMKKVKRPFDVLKGGYVIERKGNQVRELFGSAERAERFKKEDRRGARNEYRK